MRDRHGGIGRYAAHLAAQLAALPPRDLAGIELYGLTSSLHRPVPISVALDQCQDLGEEVGSRLHRLRRRFLSGTLLRAAGVDLFHSVDPAVPPLGSGCPIVSTTYDLIPLVLPDERGRSGHPLRLAMLRARLRRSYRRSAHLVAISAITRRDVVRELEVPADRVSVVHLGVDSEHFAPSAARGERDRLRQMHHLPERWFLCVSSDHRRKNHERLFDAWCGVMDRVPEGLVYVGKALYERTLQRLGEEARRRGVAERFRWLDAVDDATLPALYRHATAAVAPSLYEGFGMTLLEAMACGTPVAAARNGAYEEVGGDAALYFAPLAIEEIAQSMLRLSAGPGLRAALRERGLARAREWTWRRMALETLQVYLAVLGRVI